MKPVRNLLLPAILFLFACKKESFTSSPAAFLNTTADTLHFDTVFTSAGSVTHFVKIVNENKKGIHLSSVRLAGGASSAFRINVDGIAGPEVKGIDVAGNDSVYIFVTVSINPHADQLPFLVQDSIEISYNGNRKFVQLDAYGRNAHFFRDKIVAGTETWNNDLPYVILGGLTVDTNATLTIDKGCRIYMHADAPFIVNGTLEVNGEKYDSTRVVFAGDRLDDPYRDFPASFPGLVFTDASRNNQIQYGIIKNAYQGIVVTGQVTGTKLILNETIIDNAYDAGLLAVHTSVTARNLLVSNCGRNILLVNGGNYDFTHCTAAGFSNRLIQHKDAVLTLTNYLVQNGTVTSADLQAAFRNCIFWGENNGLVNDEVIVSKQGNTVFQVLFENVLWRVQTTPSNVTVIDSINNQDPVFDSMNTTQKFYSFRLKENSPALNKGVITGVTTDLDGNPRPVGLPDLGAYERQ
jgi:hypothetical protein